MRYSLIYSIIIVFLFSINYSRASHFSGGDITMECLGGDSFSVRLNLFRDCSGIDAPMGVWVKLSSSCSTFSSNIQLVDSNEVSQLCSYLISNSTCNNGAFPGVEMYTYEGVVHLPPCATGVWTASYSSNNRNPNNNAGQSAFYIESSMNRSLVSCNSHPQFTEDIIPYFCAGQEATYTPGIVDPDGDSLHFRLGELYIDSATTLPLQSPFTYSSPFPVPLNIDPNTGTLTFTPNSAMANGPVSNFWSFKICVDEYRYGVLIGTTCREMQVNIQPSSYCDNTNPYLISGGIQNYSGQGAQLDSNSLSFCRGDSFYFEVQFADSLFSSIQQNGNYGDSISLESNITELYKNVTVTTAKSDTATIAISGQIPHYAPSMSSFTITATDDNCPIPGKTYFLFDITTKVSTYAGSDISICENVDTAYIDAIGGNNFTWSVISGSPINISNNFKDTTNTNGASVWSFPSITTTYGIESDLNNGCNNIDTITVNIASNFNLNALGDTSVCPADSVYTYQLDAATDSSFSFTYLWSPDSLDFDTVKSPSANVFDDQTFFVTVTSADGCVKEDSVHIEFFDGTPINAGVDQIICQNTDTAFLNPSPGDTFTWSVISGDPINLGNNFSDTSSINGSNVWAQPDSTTTYQVVSNITGPCSNTDTITVNVADNFNLTAVGDTTVCSADSLYTYSLDAVTDLNLNYSYQWAPSPQFNNDTIKSPTFNVTSTGLFYVTVTSTEGCVKKDTGQILFSTDPPTYAGLDQSICQNSDTAFLNPFSGDTFTWSVISGDPISLNNNFSDTTSTYGQNVWAQPDSTTIYEVTSNLNGPCSNVDTITVNVNPNFGLSTFGDTVVCPNDSVFNFQLSAIVDTNLNFSYSWSDTSLLDSSTISNPTATVNSSKSFEVSVTPDSVCINRDTVDIIFTAPILNNASISFQDSVICKGDSTTATIDIQGPQITQSCTTTNYPCGSNPILGSIGQGTNDIGGSSYPAPYGNFYEKAKHQILYKASELHSMMNSNPGAPVIISSFGLDVAQIGNQSNFNNFEIKIGCTSASHLNSNWLSGLTTVYSAQNEVISTGWNDHVFDQSYIWDGTSNLVVEICFNNSTWVSNGNAYTNTTSTNFTSVNYYRSDVNIACNSSLSTGTSSDRPNGRFSYCNGYTPESYNYQWFPTTGVSNDTILEPFFSPNSDKIYKLIYHDKEYGLCVDTLTQSLTVLNSPEVELGNDTVFCENEQFNITLDATSNIPNSNHTWSTGQNTPALNVDSAGTYWVNVSIPNGCSSSDTIVISELQNPSVSISDIDACFGDTVYLDAGSNYDKYLWSNNDTTQGIYISSPGVYAVTVFNTASCQRSDSATVNIFPNPVVNLGPDTAVGPQHVVQLQSGYPTNTNLWSTGETTSNISVQVVSDTTIWNTVTDGNGCVGSDTIEISILTGSDRNLTKGDIKVYPNPARDNLTVSLNTESTIEFELIDLTGRILKRGSLNIGKNNLDISDLPKSNYQMRLISDDGGIIKVISVIKM